MVDSKFWDEEHQIAKVPKSELNYWQFSVVSKNGKAKISIREYYFDQKDADWRPGKQGLVIDASNISDFNKAINSCIEHKLLEDALPEAPEPEGEIILGTQDGTYMLKEDFREFELPPELSQETTDPSEVEAWIKENWDKGEELE